LREVRRLAFTTGAEDACDRSDLIELWLASWAATYPGIDFETRREWFDEHLSLLQTQGCTILTARSALGILAGFLILNRVSGWLDQIAISPDAFGAGVARELMAQAKRLSPGFLQLDVNADNSRALAFYEREGFRRTGEGTNPNSGARTLSLEWLAGPSPAA
jgi:putative acetyltransferase